MKKDRRKAGVLHIGTKVGAEEDRPICGLLGASPSASTAQQLALTVPQEISYWTLLRAHDKVASASSTSGGDLRRLGGRHGEQAGGVRPTIA